MKRRLCIITKIFSCALLATIIVTCSHPAYGTSSQDDREKEKDLRKAKGRLISEGQNKTPVGPRKLLTYRLEEVELPEPKEIVSKGKKREVTTILRLTITGEVPQGGVIWIDDVAFPSSWGAGVTSMATFINDPSVLKDGAIISVGTGSDLYDLPEPLRLPPGLNTTPVDEPVDPGNYITLRTLLKIDGQRRQRFVAIEIHTTQVLPIMNSTYSLQIGRKFFQNLRGVESNWSLELSAQEFAELKDGARITINSGFSQQIYVGRLDKTMLDR